MKKHLFLNSCSRGLVPKSNPKPHAHKASALPSCRTGLLLDSLLIYFRLGLNSWLSWWFILSLEKLSKGQEGALFRTHSYVEMKNYLNIRSLTREIKARHSSTCLNPGIPEPEVRGSSSSLSLTQEEGTILVRLCWVIKGDFISKTPKQGSGKNNSS